MNTPGRKEKLRLIAVGGIPLIVVALFAIALAVAIASMTSFGWYALAVFVGVGLVIATSTYLRTERNPKVSPVVALDGNEPLTGYFVAETADEKASKSDASEAATCPDVSVEELRKTLDRLPAAA